MKFTKFGKALLMSALSAGVILSLTSCVQSYTVGFLYVTGNETAQTNGSGIISGYKIDHNTGKLTAVNGLPVSTGGQNPVRAVLLPGSRFLYVLNRGANANGNGNCFGSSGSSTCTGSIQLFSVSGNGSLTSQGISTPTQGLNPFRMFIDSSGSFLYVLDHDAPAGAPCMATVGTATCGDITVFKIDGNTGRLSVQPNTAYNSQNGANINYFPVPNNPVDFVLSAGSVLTLYGTASTTYPYVHGTSVYPYTYNGTSGQLTVVSTGIQPLNIKEGTAIQSTGSYTYVLDNEPITANGTLASNSQLLIFTVANGVLQAATTGPIADAATLANPIAVLAESKGKWLYVANQGNNSTSTTTADSGMAAYVLNSPLQPTQVQGSPYGTGSGPQCIVEDPSNQFIYTANFLDSTVTGRQLDPNAGTLNNAIPTVKLNGQATYCLVNSRTS